MNIVKFIGNQWKFQISGSMTAAGVSVLIGLSTLVTAQVSTQGFLNLPRTEAPGTLLSHPIINGSELIGRTTSVNYLNGWVIVGGEQPGSRPGSDWQMRVYDVSNPTSPVRRLPSDFGLSYSNNSWHFGNIGWNAHGTAQAGNMLLPQVVRVNGFGGLVERGGTNGIPQNGQLLTGYNRSSQAGPWEASFPWYGAADETFSIHQVYLNAGGGTSYRNLANFDHVGPFGGGDWHPMFFGDLLIYARSGGAGSNGVVVYRMQYNNWEDPATRSITAQYVSSLGSGFVGYWPTFYSDGTALYVIGAGTDVIMAADITPATVAGGNDEVTLVANLTVPGLTNAPYPVYQDNHGFIHNRKIDMNRLVAGDSNPIVLTLNENAPPVPSGAPTAPSGVDTSQMSLALGNLWLTGGYPNGTLGQPNYQAQGMGVWVHQQTADTNPPQVTYHIPQSGRTNYPRQAPLSFLIFEHGSRGAPRNGIDFTVRPVGTDDALGPAVEGFLIHDFSGVLTFTPTDSLTAETTYQVDFLSHPATQVGWRDAAGNYIEPYSFRFSTGGGLNAVPAPVWTSFTANIYQPAPNQPVTVTAAATGTGILDYRFNFDGNWTAWSGTATAPFTYTTAGRPRVLAQVRDSAGNVITQSLSLLVISPPPPGPRPTQSSAMAIGNDAGMRRLWSVNPDSNTVSVLNAETGEKMAEHAVGENPRCIARDANGRYWVTCHQSDEIRILNGNGTLFQTLALEYGDGPYGIVPSPDGMLMYVTLFSGSKVLRYSVASPTSTPLSQTTFPTPRAIAVSADGSRVLVTRFISAELQGEVGEFSAALANVRTFPLALANTTDGGDRAAGVPNYLAGIAISPDGNRASVVGKQDNTLRGLAFGVPDLTHETTVRSVITFLDLVNHTEVRHTRRDFDNSDSPTAVSYTPAGDTLLVTLQGNNTLVGMDALNLTPLVAPSVNGSMVTQPAVVTLEVATGLAPQGLLVDSLSNRIFTQDFMGRSVSVFDGQPLLLENRTSLPVISTTNSVSQEPLTPQVLTGKQIFYNAADPRMSADSYISCATCHVDGGHDGRIWDFTGRGEGLRRTTDLRGRGGMGHGAVHWSGNFDEIQDFEHDIRGPFGGTGFLNLSPQEFGTLHPNPATGKTGLSNDLDALAAYVRSLSPAHVPRSPHRSADGTFTTAALAGQAVFNAQSCSSCHGGPALTNSTLTNVGTQSPLSGLRLGQPLTGIDTPTLHGLHATRVYLHHGQANTLGEVFSYGGGTLDFGAQAQFVDATRSETNNPLEGGGGFARGYFGGSAAYLTDNANAAVRFNNVDGGNGGTARIAFRYLRQYNSGTANFLINGVSQNFTALQQSPNNDWQVSGWRWHSVEAMLNPGTTNTIEIQRGGGNDLRINVLQVSNADVLTQAQAHRVVQNLPTTDRASLVAYLMQLDGRDANGIPLLPPALPSPQPPGIVIGPISQTLAAGNTLGLSVAVAGTGPFAYQWYRGATPIGTNSPFLTIQQVQTADTGSYTVTITNARDNITSTPVQVMVNPPLSITTFTLPSGTDGVSYQTNLSAAGGVASRTWSVVSGYLPPGLLLSADGNITGTPTAAARAEFVVRVADRSGSTTQALALNIAPVGGFSSDPDLILHYPFDEGSGNRVWDIATGGNNHSSTVAGATWSGNGRFGGAYGTDGSTSVIDFSPLNQADLDFDPRAHPFTISLWVRTTSPGGYRTAIGKDLDVSPWNNAQYRIWTAGSTSSLQGVSGNQYSSGLSIPALDDGQWHLLTLVNDLDGATWRGRLYFDNGASFTQWNSGAGGPTPSLMRIGDTSRGGNGWAGQLDDLRIYRRALTQPEIAALYNPPPAPTFATWIAGLQNPPHADSRDPNDDPDNDGLQNILEYLLGGDPTSRSSAPRPTLGLFEGEFRYFVRRDPTATGWRLTVETSADLNSWAAVATSDHGAAPVGSGVNGEIPGTPPIMIIGPGNEPDTAPRFYRTRATPVP